MLGMDGKDASTASVTHEQPLRRVREKNRRREVACVLFLLDETSISGSETSISGIMPDSQEPALGSGSGSAEGAEGVEGVEGVERAAAAAGPLSLLRSRGRTDGWVSRARLLPEREAPQSHARGDAGVRACGHVGVEDRGAHFSGISI